MQVILRESKYWGIAEKNGITRTMVEDSITAGIEYALKKLPPVSDYLTIMVCADVAENVIPETGVAGITYTEEYMSIIFDAAVPLPREEIIANLRQLVIHEMVHAASYINAGKWIPAPLQAVVYEGLATYFEAKAPSATIPPWAKCEDDATMKEWLAEVSSLNTEMKNFDYLFDHPDGRRWIIYKTGMWIVN